MTASYDWIGAVLRGIDAPNGAINRRVFYLWARSEGMRESYHNPLATTRSCCGGVSINRVGVKRYPTWRDGVRATVDTLYGYRYGPIVSALRREASEYEIWREINRSPWCRGCSGGHYPVALYEDLQHSAQLQRQEGGERQTAPPASRPVDKLERAWRVVRDAAERTVPDSASQLRSTARYIRGL